MVPAALLFLVGCAQGPSVQDGKASGDFTIVNWDNPDFTEFGVKLTPANTKWNGMMDRTITVTPLGVANGNGDFRVETLNGDGPAVTSGLSVFASVRDEELPARPDAEGMYSSATGASVDLVAHGLRVGYTRLDVRLRQIEPNRSTPAPFDSLHLKLDEAVSLVPVQAVVVYATKDAQGKFKSSTESQRRPAQLMFWDHWPDVETTNITDGQFGEITTAQHAMSWVRRDATGAYRVSTQTAPDGIWHRCGVQFRLVNYFELEVPQRNVFPATGNEEQDPNRFWATGTSDRTPLQDNLARAKRDPRFMEGATAVIFMDRVSFPEAPEVGRALIGEDAIGVSLTDGRSTDGVVGHELGHLSGMNDAEAGNSAWNVMWGLGPGIEPTDNECRVMKRWADKKKDFWMVPRANPDGHK